MLKPQDIGNKLLVEEEYEQKNYFTKTTENNLIASTECIGNLNAVTKEFNDYFETHLGEFFTPELHSFAIYHDNRSLYDIQAQYRDP